jgi:hypothetical protein
MLRTGVETIFCLHRRCCAHQASAVSGIAGSFELVTKFNAGACPATGMNYMTLLIVVLQYATSAARCALLLHPHFTNAVSLCITFVTRGMVPTNILRLRRAPPWESWPPHLALCSRIKSRQPRDSIWMVCGRLNNLLCNAGMDLAEGISTGCMLTQLTVCGSMDTDEHQHLP